MSKKDQLEYLDREITRINQNLRLLKGFIEILAEGTDKEEIIKKLRYVV